MKGGGKVERPLFINMDFEEALARFSQTKPEEVEPPKGRKRKTTKAKRSGGPEGEPSTD